ncbi:MAG: T9SS type A sorting domain-containing protein [Sphingobacteriales bacterium]|nr:T9SS type A sorting domain-containing protein [Sphingobacteriales bacterium]
MFTTAVGNDANSGVPSAPLLTLTAAYNKAQAGDTIYVDAGFYQTSIDITLNKSITILGTNYQISPKDPSNSLQLNSARLPESIVVNHSFIIAANDIRIKGFYFDPASKTQIQQTVTTNDFDNIEIEKNVFSIVSNITSINITGKQITPLVTVNYSINDNRFVKEFGTGGTTISINAIDAVQINNNVFTTNNLYFNNARIQTGIVVGGLTGDIVISNNSAYQQNFFINGISAKKTTISFNSADECNRFAFSSSGNVNPNELEITDNIITNPRSTGGPVISYVRSNGINLSSPNIARIERNTITLNATGLTNVAQALIAPTLDAASANTQVFIRNNKLSITGDFSSLSSPSAYVSAIRYLTNSRYTLVERNEMEFSATNYGASNKFGIGILHSGLQPDASFNFLNNKFSGFPTSIGIQNQATGNYGELPIGLTFSINNNSFTSDGMSINNGVSGQSALANCNWYGSASAQNFINKLSLSTVDIVPWLTNGTDNDVATGFQPVPGSCDGYPTLIVLDSYTNVNCNGAASGTINITTSYGKAPFTYTWTKDGDANFVSHEEDPTGLTAGVYHLTIVDGNGSNIYITDPEADGPGTIDVTITEPSLLTASATGTNNLCNGNTAGTATVTPAGIYSVTVTDANGCTASSSYEVTQPSLLTANASGSDVSCFGGSNGTATVLAGGGITVYSYLWSNGATTSSISNLSAGIYSVTVTDANGCTASSSYEVTEPAQLTASAGGTNVSCFNNSNGTASVNAVGGTAPYSYSWSNGSSSQNISNLAAGVYTVTVKDANGCMATSSYEVTQPALPLTANASGTNVSCFNGTNGTASVTVTGGTVPYTYSWSNGSSSQNISNLAAGTYTVTVTDANGCTATSNTSITQPSAIVITIGTITNTCSGAGNGSISSSATGGTGILTYNWTGPNGFSKASKNISNLVAGVYKLTVTDANNCTVTAQATVNALPAITASSVVTDITCYNTSTGAINLTPGGGTGVFSFSWTGPNGFKASTEDISNVKAGAYSVTITDAAGCTAVYSYPVGTPSAAVSLSVQKTDAVCSSGGSLTITGNGGRTPYTYSINGTVFQSSNVFSNLAAGTYNAITIKDNSGCTVVAAVITIVNSDSYEIYSNEKQNVSNLNTTIAFNQAIAARISPTATDKDWYNIKTGAVPGTVTVSLTHPSVAYTFGLYDNKGKIVGVSSSTATTKTYNALLPNAVYSIQISGTVASASCYTLLVTSTAVPVAARVMSQNLQPVITTDKLAAMVYPNPHHGSFGIRIEASQSGTATVEIINITGQRIELRKVAIIKGSNNVVRFSNMRQSALIYKVTMGDEVKTGKIISAN